ncbi:MAG TPA: prephenate dehydratase domain-containing protein [Acidimicrobiales bacterium]|nr:prephenate dehydratase domain-containing protein [Acidimicrobiales bacterium]
MVESPPGALVVVGAAAGMGRWLVEHALGGDEATTLVLVDRDSVAGALRELDATGPVVRVEVADGVPRLLDTGEPMCLPDADVAVCLAVPADALANVCRWLLPLLPADAPLLHVAPRLGPALEELQQLAPDHPVLGAHPLFDSSARELDGQTVLVVPGDRPDTAWFVDRIVGAGGIARVVTAEDHDRTMSYVQTMAHQTLLNLVQAVVTSGVPVEQIWECRTPLFETLFGLAVRILAEGRQATTAEIQAELDGDRVVEELRAAAERTGAVLGSGRAPEVERLVHDLREAFASGTLFKAIEDTAGSALSAVQAKRAELARHGRTRGLVGVAPLGRPDALRVGRITEVTPTAVTLLEVMVGEKGSAGLLEGPGRRNAGRVGRSGKPKETVFGLAHIDLVVGDELDRALDDWLAHLRRDIRFLVPESVAGAGVLTVVRDQTGVREAEVVSEAVRTGQRSVVIRVGIRADHDVDEMVELLRSRVQGAYVWPTGLALPVDGRPRLHYLGPPGTFSEDAAVHAHQSVGVADAELVPEESFPDVLAGVAAGDLATIPVSSSASGLVSRAAAALLGHDGPLEAGGVVDVAVRLDAYVQPDRALTELRGAPVYSHPQALAQCSAFIRRWDLVAEPCASTVEALARLATGDGQAVALAGADRAGDLDLKVAEREVDDLSGSITRFVILGPPGTFGELTGGDAPTLRSIVVADDVASVRTLIEAGEPAFDELLTAADGQCLWITSREVTEVPAGLRSLGRIPWSPRTPVVRVAAG